MISLGSINSALFKGISRNLKRQSTDIGNSLERIITGNRLLPGEEPATQSFLSRLDSQIRGVGQAQLNVSATSGLVATADQALQNMSDIAASLRDLAIQAQDNSLTSADRSLLQEQAALLTEEFSNYSKYTEFDGQKLLNNTFGSKSVQVGPNSGESFSFSIGDARATTLGKLAIYSGAQGSITAAIGGGANALSINNVNISASSNDGYSTLYSDRSALSIANAINAKSGETNVTAEVLGTERTLYIDNFSGGFSGTFASGDFQINGVDVNGTIADVTDLITEINDVSGTTGVSASLDGNGDITLSAVDGRNIELTVSNSTGNNVYDIFNISANNGTDLFENSVVVSTDLSSGSDEAAVGAVRLYSSSKIYISGGSSASQSVGIGQGNLDFVGGTSFANLNFSTTDDADQALKILDSTIADISTLRANIGAVHDRLDRTASSLVERGLVLEDTKEAVGGTDFSVEVAKLAMAQFLQDATLASLTQANTSYEKVTDLLDTLKKD